jgi:hypothetical protein
MPKALEAPFSLVLAIEAVSLFDVVDLSRCRKMFIVLIPPMHQRKKKTMSAACRGSSHIVAPKNLIIRNPK